MNFSVDGSDAWDSTPAQEIFIQNYFTKKEPSNDIVTKRSKKRKKHLLSSDKASTSMMPNYFEKKTSDKIPKSKNSNKKSKITSLTSLEISSAKFSSEENETRRDVTINFVNKSLEKNSNVLKSSKTGSPKMKNFSQKSCKNKKEMSDCTKESPNYDNIIDKSLKRNLQNNNSPSKKVNLDKNKSNIGQISQVQNKPYVAENYFEIKTTKNTSYSKKNYLNSDDSDDLKNQVIHNKLQNIKKRKLKKKNTSQIQNKPLASESNFKTMLKALKNTSNPNENYLNSDDSEVEASRSNLQNKKKGKSKTIQTSQINESDDSKDEVTHSELQNLKKMTSKTTKASQIHESVYSEYDVTQSKLPNLKKKKPQTSKASQIDESDDSENEVNQSKIQNQKKRKSKISKVLQIDESDDSEDEVHNKKKRKSKISKESKFKNKSSETEINSQTKKIKGAEKTSNSKESCLNINDSDVSEDEEVIRSELQNTRMFMKIQKLMKLAPHLNPNFVKDSAAETNNSPFDDISTENSSSESDSECSLEGENEDVPKDNEKDSSAGHSEDSLNSDEEDTSECKEVSYSQESHQTISKQEIPIQQLETCSRKTSNIKKPNSLMEKARAKLASAKFRFLNEKLYTESGGEAFQYFQANKEEFEDYHLGYGQQVSKWPLNPVDVILVDLQKMKKGAVIADLGCGDAKIARVLNKRAVHSFDLVAKHKCVTACDMSRVPLPDSSVDVAVFCLSLMGVNLVDYLREAYRILKIGGTLTIAEVESRIENLDLFIGSLNSLGFILERKNTNNKLFVFLDLKKVKKGKASKAPTIKLRPCLYKKR